MSNRIIHFEIPVDDPDRATKFYAGIFGWDITRWDGPIDYWLVKTGPDGTRGINGAFIKRSAVDTVVNTVAVQDLRASLAKVTECGGSIVQQMTIPSIGEFAYCRDTEGNLFAMLQPLEQGS